MIDNLTDTQLSLARWIGRAIEEGKLEESFHAIWGTGLSPVQQPIVIRGDGEWTICEFTYGDFTALTEEGLLRMTHDGGHAFPKGVKGYAPTDRHFSVTVTKRLLSAPIASKPSQDTLRRQESSIHIFISHSGADADLAEILVDLLRAALNISHEKIRCTSVDGYRLPAGASTDDQLKQEVRFATCFIALLTPTSLKSPYVLFELGARWGAELPFLPLLARGITGGLLGPPLSGLNALSCASASQIHQLLADTASTLHQTLNNPATYEKYVQRLLHSSETSSHSPHRSPRSNDPAPASETSLSQAANELLELVTRETDPELKGLVEIRKEVQPGITHFFPRLQYAGNPLAMKSRLFREAVKQLTAHGFFHPPGENESTNTLTYEFREKHADDSKKA